ncbi:MAG TPA: adenosylcobinamide-GDP ribazoletransferase [Ilumatobacter sp.]|nr:adenosylcobinamide-GDP ribazoletransferase [Ilumatobacter sp.]
MSGLLAALRFLTRVPIPGRHDVPHRRAVPWFPLAGALIGAAVGGLAAGLAEWLTPMLAATLAVVAGLLITGAFHEDGLADCADAYGGGWDREQRLAILKDSRHGTYGVAALCASIVVRVVAAGSLAGQAALFAGFVAAHTLGRAAAVAMLEWVRPADPAAQGLGVSAGRDLGRGAVAGSLVAGVGITALATGWWAVPLVAAAALGAAAVAVLSVRKIGGVVGDALGAAEQVAECLVLVMVAALAAHHQLWWT